jgi:membrane protein DedA with SNARE-associated domain
MRRRSYRAPVSVRSACGNAVRMCSVASRKSVAVEHFLSSWGYLALALLAVAEAACIPIPSEVTVSFGGYLASTGKLELALVIVIATVGETVGALIGYSIGRFGGRRLVDRFGRYVLLTHADLDRAQSWFDGRGEWGVLIGRVVPVIRTFISLVAGVAEMQPVRFAVLTFLGSLIWVGALAGVGYGLGGEWHRITHGFSLAGYGLIALAVVVVGVWIINRWRHMRAEREALERSESSDHSETIRVP